MDAGGTRARLAALALAVTLGLLGAAARPLPARAAMLPAACSAGTGSAGSLAEAITKANEVTGADTVALGPRCVYTLTSIDNFWYGPNALPPIASDITIEGNGATIARSPSAAPFRLLFVGADPGSSATPEYVSPAHGVPGGGRLTLRNVTLAGGLARGGGSDRGGGGAGMGGAIFNQGTVVIEASTLDGNTAEGGSAIDATAGIGGGGIGNSSFLGIGGGFGVGPFPEGGSGGKGGEGGGGGGAGLRVNENGHGAAGTLKPGAGGGVADGLGGGESSSSLRASGGDGSGGGGAFDPPAGEGGQFGSGGGPSGGFGGGGGGGVGGGGGGAGEYAGSGGFGGGGGASTGGGEGGGDGGFGGGGGGAGSGPRAGRSGFGAGVAEGTLGGGGAGMGGAIFNMQGGVTIVDSTVAGNVALGGADEVKQPAQGIAGAVFNLSGSLQATASTFAANTASKGSAQIYNLGYDSATPRGAVTTLRDTILAGGIGPADLGSSASSEIVPAPNVASASADVSQFDLVRAGIAEEGGTITGTPLTADPLLGSLQNNGGPTATLAPGPGSPVIDAGAAFGLHADQRGLARPSDFASLANAGDGSDIGAVELQAPPLAPATPTTPTGPTGPSAPAAVLDRLSRLRISPSAFPAAARGPSAVSARARRPGAIVSYTGTAAASTTFTVQRPLPGRVQGRSCVKPSTRNGSRRRCSRWTALGSFVRADLAGANRFRFTGRIAGRRLRPAHYRLRAVPRNTAGPGPALDAAFSIIR
jgi:hypothetical protein